VTAGGWTEPAYAAVVRLLGARTGLAFAPHRHDGAEAGIRRAMAKAGVAEVARYLERLESGALALDDVVSELTVGETYFFRDPAQFEFIRCEALPDLLRRRGPGHVLRALSAGCASGEEAYSLAILLEQEGLEASARVLGVDISRPALARAREAAYGPWSLRGVEEAIVRRYFRARDGRHALDERMRRRVDFEYLNLALDTYPSFAGGVWGIDLILCRNVLIYLDRAAVRRVAERLFLTLAEGGWLVTGASDPPLAGEAPFETVVAPAGVFYRRSITARRVFAVRHESPPPAEPAPWPPVPPSPVPEPAPAEPVRPEAEDACQDPFARAREALAAGDYARALELARGLEDAASAALRVRAIANREGSHAASQAAEAAAQRHPLAPELHFLHAVLLLDLGRLEEALESVRRVLYLDRSLAAAHFALGSLLRRRGDVEGARRAFRNSAELAGARPPDEPVPLGDGERAGRLAQAAAAEMALLEETAEARP